MVDKKRGPFGRTGDGRVLPCQCSGCCGKEWEEFPDTIEARIYTTFTGENFDWKGPMYKNPKGRAQCTCGNTVGIISYSTHMWKILTDQWPADDSEVCCLKIALQGSCSSGQGPTFDLPPGIEIIPAYDPPLPFGECGWALSLTWNGGDNLAVGIDVTPSAQNPSLQQLASCDPIELTGEFGGSEIVAACILGRAGTEGPDVHIEIKEDGVGGDEFTLPAVPCKFLCWETFKRTLHAVLDSSCPEIDGLELDLEYGNDAWVGEVAINNCDVIRVAVGQYWRDYEAEPCPVTIIVSIKGDCVQEIIGGGSAPFPPPWSASGTITEACSCLCVGDTISVEIME
jgi:hypothetical protein